MGFLGDKVGEYDASGDCESPEKTKVVNHLDALADGRMLNQGIVEAMYRFGKICDQERDYFIQRIREK